MAVQHKEHIEGFDDDKLSDSSQITNTDTLSQHDDVEHTADNIYIYVVEQIIKTWSEQHTADIKLRESYAKYLLMGLLAETISITGIFVCIGVGWLVFSERTVHLFLGSAYAQIVGSVIVIVKYLFSKDSHVILKDIAEIVGKIRGNTH